MGRESWEISYVIKKLVKILGDLRRGLDLRRERVERLLKKDEIKKTFLHQKGDKSAGASRGPPKSRSSD